MRLAQSPRELSSPVPHVRCAELAQLWLNPIMSIMVERYAHQNGAHIRDAMDKLEERYTTAG